MFSKLTYMYFLLLNIRLSYSSIQENPIIRIGQGKIEGKVMENLSGGKFYGFQGIPYAKPPIGHLRFKSPEPADSWSGVLNATKEGSSCLQLGLLPPGALKGSEDCLYLNVYTPKLPEASNEVLRPVMVLLHGGGFIVLDGGVDLFGPDYLLTEDIVYVSLNYRLNVFGFLSFEDPSFGIPGNAGLKDMVLALKWVQANIASFNGDPNKVTIFGESAGGAAVNLMQLSESAKGLFHRAISMSGVASAPWVFNDRQYKTIAKHLNYSEDLSDQQKIFKLINSTSGEKLLGALFQINFEPSRYIGQYGEIGPVIENPESNPDAFITSHPETILKQFGPINQVPSIIGFVRDEGALFLKSLDFISPTFTENTKLVPKYLNITRDTPKNQEIGDKIKKFYYGEATPSYENVQNYINMMSDIAFSHKIVETAKLILANTTQPLYFYKFEYISDLNYMSLLLDLPFPIVCHADDVGYLFPFSYGPADIEPNSIEMRGLHRMVKMWTNFAHTGNPNAMDNDQLLNVIWPPARLEDFYYLNIDDNLTVHPLSNLIPERLQFWEDLDKEVL